MRQSLSSALPKTDQPPGPEPGARRKRAPAVEKIASWSASHRKTAVLGWLLLVAAAFVAGQVLGTKNLPQYDPGSAGRAERTLHQLGVTSPPAETVLIQARGPGDTFAGDPEMRQAARQVTAALTGLRTGPGHLGTGQQGTGQQGTGQRGTGQRAVLSIRSPFDQAGLVSADGRSALVTFKLAGSRVRQDVAVTAAQRAVAGVQSRHPGLTIQETGEASVNKAVNESLGRDFRKAEVTSVPITLALLLLVFGALIAAGIPVLLAGSAVMTAISLLAIPSRWLPVGSSTSEVVLLIGMAVGIDYSLFYLRREREERARGATFGEALRTAAATSGRAIVVSGLTVMIAVAGLFMTGIDVFTGVAFGMIAVVGIAVLGSITVLPALLSWLGRRADGGRVPLLGRRRTAARPSRLWAALVGRVVRHPALWGGSAALALLALAAPALGMRTGYPAIDAPRNLPAVATMNKIQHAFPRTPSPADVLVTGRADILDGAQTRQAINALRSRASASGPILRPVSMAPVAGGRALLVEVPLAGDGTDSVSNNALAALRDRVLPATLGRVAGLSYGVSGETAGNYDFSRQLHARTPVVFAAVAVLAMVLMLLAFRSIAIPLISIGLNLLSVGAAYGLITLIFQDGHLQGLLGFTSYGGIIPWIPLFMFVFLFGLSMDYHVFILSRIRELRSRGATTRDAITTGIASSAGVVTSAAVIMVAVFSIFAALSLIDLKMIGVGVAAAVLIDATVVRGVLVPATMTLFGDRCWYLPRWLRWLPASGRGSQGSAGWRRAGCGDRP
jgi:putative drug exporter of the RND superfamily